MEQQNSCLVYFNDDLESSLWEFIQDELILYRYSKAPVKTLKDMSAKEILKIEKEYNCKVKKEIRDELSQLKDN